MVLSGAGTALPSYFEDGFYDRLKQSAGIMPTPTLEQIAYHNAIWIHAASVGEVVAASPIVRELKKRYPKEMVVVSVVTATGHRMAQRIMPEADGHIFFLLICLLSQNEL